VDLDAGTVDEQPVRRIACSRRCAENGFPYATLGPADEPVVERLLGPIDIGAVGPTPAAAKGMNDPAQHATIIHARLAAHIGRQQWLDPSPLRIRKPKEISHITASLREQ
jgi:hypothetical protein